jgi:hypothetical protein
MIKLLLLSVSYTSNWIEPCTNPQTACLTGDPQLARWAFNAWQAASQGRLHFVETQVRSTAQIPVEWDAPSSGHYGETVGKEVHIRIAADGVKDPLLRDTIVYLTCLHEIGHALGLRHTANFEDAMYNFQYGGDIPEYFARYRRKLLSRDDIRKNSGLSVEDRARIASLHNK